MEVDRIAEPAGDMADLAGRELRAIDVKGDQQKASGAQHAGGTR